MKALRAAWVVCTVVLCLALTGCVTAETMPAYTARLYEGRSAIELASELRMDADYYTPDQLYAAYKAKTSPDKDTKYQWALEFSRLFQVMDEEIKRRTSGQPPKNIIPPAFESILAGRKHRPNKYDVEIVPTHKVNGAVLCSFLNPEPMEEALRLYEKGDYEGFNALVADKNKGKPGVFLAYLRDGLLVRYEGDHSPGIVKVTALVNGLPYYTLKAALVEYTPPPKKLGITITIGGGPSDGSVSAAGLLPPYQHNAYGPGVHADGTGRPFTYQPANPGDNMPVMGPVQRDGYGLGMHMDQFGRPVRDRPRW